MKIMLFSVFDDKLGEFNTPMAFQSRGLASRSFLDELKREDPSNMLNKHPEDFTLYHVGSFDSQNGSFESPSVPECILRGDVVIE